MDTKHRHHCGILGSDTITTDTQQLEESAEQQRLRLEELWTEHLRAWHIWLESMDAPSSDE